MTKPKAKPATAADAVRAALAREEAKRPEGLKPIEVVKVAISAYQAYEYADGTKRPIARRLRTATTGTVDNRMKASAERTITTASVAKVAPSPAASVESDDRIGLRRGTQASVDRLLFNVNYWRAAYEDRIVAACSNPKDAHACLRAISAWNSHTMKLNTLPAEEVVATFERFCPPLATNNRRGSQGEGRGKGPVHDFRTCALEVASRENARTRRGAYRHRGGHRSRSGALRLAGGKHAA